MEDEDVEYAMAGYLVLPREPKGRSNFGPSAFRVYVSRSCALIEP